MKEKSKSNFITIKKATKDLFALMPGIVTVKIVFGIVSALISILNVNLLANIIDYAGRLANSEPVVNTFIISVVSYILCYIVLQISSVGMYYIDNILIVPKMEHFHHRLSEHLVNISLEATHDPQIQNMFWRAKDAIYQDRIMSVFMTVFNIVPIIIQLIGTMIVLYSYSWILVLLAFLSVFPSAIISFWIGRKEYNFSIEQTQTSRLSSYLWEIMTKKETIRENRIYGFLDYIKKYFFSVQQKVLKARKKLLIKEDAGRSLAELLKNALYIVALILAVGLVSQNVITVGMFAACIGVFSTMQGSASNLFSYFSQIDNICNYANDYYDFLNLPKDKSGTSKLENGIKSIELKNVSYSYNNNQKFAVENVDLKIERGNLIVIVGENGSGKTTLSKLIMGLYKPQFGSLLVNGIPQSEIQNTSYLHYFSIAIQDFERYAIPLSDNIIISDIANRTQDLDEFFTMCDLTDVKERLGGYDAMLGIEFGDADLSGGEWQRVALARAMYKNADIIVLDEPTSAIDPLLEFDLLNQFLNMAKNRTCIVISHRIGLCKKADKIVVMHNGKIVEQGTHDFLIQRQGKYSELWNAQSKWYK